MTLHRPTAICSRALVWEQPGMAMLSVPLHCHKGWPGLGTSVGPTSFLLTKSCLHTRVLAKSVTMTALLRHQHLPQCLEISLPLLRWGQPVAGLCLTSHTLWVSVLLKALIPVWALKRCPNYKIFCNFCLNKPIIFPATATLLFVLLVLVCFVTNAV